MILFNKIPFISALITGRKLAEKGYAERPEKYRKKQYNKIFYFTLLNPRFAYRWFIFFNSAEFSKIAMHRPTLYVKPFRHYISIKWNKKRRVKVILDTYKFIESKGDLFQRFLTRNEGIVIAKIKLENDYDGLIKLTYNYAYRKEGELALSLDCEQLGGRITSVAFSFEELAKGKWVSLIGCIQGHKNKNVQDAFKSMQKSLFALRPNSLIIYVAQEFLRNLDVHAIYGIANSIHITNRKNALNLPWKKNITFDYDNFWDEIGGKKINKDWFEIPLNPIRKTYEEIKPHKRALYRKRYEMLDDISLQIQDGR